MENVKRPTKHQPDGDNESAEEGRREEGSKDEGVLPMGVVARHEGDLRVGPRRVDAADYVYDIGQREVQEAGNINYEELVTVGGCTRFGGDLFQAIRGWHDARGHLGA